MNFRIIVGIAIILMGLGFLIDFPFFNMFFALILIYMGIRFISGRGFGFSFASGNSVRSEKDSMSRVMVFTSTKLRNESQDFQGGEVVTVFAEGELDLRNAKSNRAVVTLETVCVFGSLSVRVPADWEINTDGVGILGSFNDNTTRPATPAAKLHLEGASVFGSIEITN